MVFKGGSSNATSGALSLSSEDYRVLQSALLWWRVGSHDYRCPPMQKECYFSSSNKRLKQPCTCSRQQERGNKCHQTEIDARICQFWDVGIITPYLCCDQVMPKSNRRIRWDIASTVHKYIEGRECDTIIILVDNGMNRHRLLWR